MEGRSVVMASFKDTEGREWLVTLNTAQVKRVKQRLGINLADPQESDVLHKLADAITLVDVLYVLVEKQAKERSVSDESFGEALGGDTLESASTAILEALCDFFPRARRMMMRKVLAEVESQRVKAIELLERDGDELIRKAFDQAAQIGT